MLTHQLTHLTHYLLVPSCSKARQVRVGFYFVRVGTSLQMN
jgi:hypothetical protein